MPWSGAGPWPRGPPQCRRLVYPRTVTLAYLTLAYLTNQEGSVIILIVFLTIAATVIFVRLCSRGRRRASPGQTELTLLERIEAMTDEEYEVWRAEGRSRYEAQKKRPQQSQHGHRHVGPDHQPPKYSG